MSTEEFLAAVRAVPAERWVDSFDEYPFLGKSWSAWTKAFHRLLGTEAGRQRYLLWHESCSIVGWGDEHAKARLALDNATYAVVLGKQSDLLSEAVGLVGVRIHG